jgi:ubiquinone/menaquinone biosynthesis C-methylase UbiE
MSDTDQHDTPHHTPESEQTLLVQRRFGATAQAYATSTVHSQGPDLDWIVEAAALSGKEQVVDVATGTGHTAFALAPHAHEVVAIDITAPMLAAAQKLAAERHITNVRFLQANALTLPLPNNSVDLVACRHSAHHFLQVSQAVREWVRVLRPGGKVVLADSISPEEPEVASFLNEIELIRDPSHIRNYSPTEWLALLNENGLTASVQRTWGIPLDIPSWTQRMQTPPEGVERIIQKCADASPLQRERLHIEQHEGIYSFILPAAMFVGVKSA